MYPVWASAAASVLFLATALVLFVGKIRRVALGAVIVGVIAGGAAIAMYAAAEARYADCAEGLSPLTDQLSYCARVVFGDPGPRSLH